VRRVLTDLRKLELKIRGADLVAAGVPQGPEIGRALEATRRARLDGVVEGGPNGFAGPAVPYPPFGGAGAVWSGARV